MGGLLQSRIAIRQLMAKGEPNSAIERSLEIRMTVQLLSRNPARGKTFA